MNWKYKIKIKDKFENETTPELVAELCKIISGELGVILDKSQNSNITQDSIDDFWYDLEGCQDNFDFLLKLADGTIEESEWENYSFDGDFEREFNGYLEELYDIGDRRVTLKNNAVEKLLWIG
jgi:hypothetical protein